MSPRKAKCRLIEKEFQKHFFKPRGVPLRDLQKTTIGHDELEAVRLVDVEHRSQEEAANQMEISSSTLQRIIQSAREKIGKAIIQGYAIEIDGGTYDLKERS